MDRLIPLGLAGLVARQTPKTPPSRADRPATSAGSRSRSELPIAPQRIVVTVAVLSMSGHPIYSCDFHYSGSPHAPPYVSDVSAAGPFTRKRERELARGLLQV